jgi:hypothetical protein
MMVLSAIRKTTLGLTCKLGIGKNLVPFFVNPPKRKTGSVAKVRTTFCYIQHVAILILGKFNMEHAPKILRQNVQPVTAALQPVKVRPQFSPRRAV